MVGSPTVDSYAKNLAGVALMAFDARVEAIRATWRSAPGSEEAFFHAGRIAMANQVLRLVTGSINWRNREELHELFGLETGDDR